MSRAIKVLLIVAICLLLMGIVHPKLSGAIVLSGSMEDSISANDMVIIYQSGDYKVGDVISFKSGSMLVTHRIIEETDKGYITQGDANNTNDGEVIREAVVGKVILVIPKVGSLVSFIKSPLGMLLMLICLFVIYKIPFKGSKSRKEEVTNE